MRRAGILLTALTLLMAAPPARALDQDQIVTPEQKKMLEEMEAKIEKLKAEGKLEGDRTGTSTNTTTSTSTGTSTSTSADGAQNGCTRLKTGDSVIVQWSDDESPTGVGAGYGLSHPQDDTYLVEVNMRFVKGASYKKEIAPKDLDAGFHTRISACLKEYEGSLRNERAGKKMVLRLSNNAALPVHEISIVDKLDSQVAYADAATYPAEIGCATALHEILHLLGLPDEYKDKPAVNEPLKDCRPLSAKDSIMTSSREAKNALSPQLALAVEMCRCDKPGDACWTLAEKNDGKKCPPGTTSFLKTIDPGVKSSLNVLNTSEAFVLNEQTMANGTAPPTHLSILYPAHFRAITEPGCRDVNANYYDCVIGAYRSSKASGPTGAPPGCPAKPPACQFNRLQWLE